MSIVMKRFTYSFTALLIFSFLFPAAGNGAEFKQISSPFNHAGKIEYVSSQQVVSSDGSSELVEKLQVRQNTSDSRYEGEVKLEESSGQRIQIPVSIYVGEGDVPDVVSDIDLDPMFFSPNDDGVLDTTDIRFNINSTTEYFSLDVYESDEDGTFDWIGTIVETVSGIDPGSYIVRGWDGTLEGSQGKLSLNEGGYVVVPWHGTFSNISPIPDQASSFAVDVTAPVSTLDATPITVNNGAGIITGQIESDLMIDLLGDYSAINVAAFYNDNGLKQANGVIADDGSFSIKAPLRLGLNTFEIYVSDIAGNGMLEPADIVEYRKVDALWALITEAEQLLEETEEGNAPGQYPAEARAALGQVIAAAVSVAKDEDAKFEEVSQMMTELQAAIDAYNAAVVPAPDAPVWEQGKLDVLNVTRTAVELGWSPAKAQAGVTGYRIYIDPNQEPAQTVTGDVYSYTLLNLSSGTTYTFTVKAYNEAGESTCLSATATTLVDNTALLAKVEEARTKLDESREGTGPGQYPAGARAALERAIVAALSVANDNDATQRVVNGALAALQKALDDYIAAEVKPPTRSSTDSGYYLSGDAYLRELAVLISGANVPLTPEFVTNTMSYKVETESEDAELLAVPAHSARVILGEVQVNRVIKVSLDEGENVFELIVHAEDGTRKTYTLTIDRKTTKPDNPEPHNLSFTDTDNHWAEQYIKDAVAKGFISGYPDGTFKPDHLITRAEFTVMLTGALRLKDEGTVLAFTDSDKIGSWAKQAVAQAVTAGIIDGYADGSFRANEPITRVEIVAMIARALELLVNVQVQTDFADDDDIPQWAKGAVDAIQRQGIVAGRGDNRFVPNDKATRSEAVVMVLRILEAK